MYVVHTKKTKQKSVGNFETFHLELAFYDLGGMEQLLSIQCFSFHCMGFQGRATEPIKISQTLNCIKHAREHLMHRTAYHCDALH